MICWFDVLENDDAARKRNLGHVWTVKANGGSAEHAWSLMTLESHGIYVKSTGEPNQRLLEVNRKRSQKPLEVNWRTTEEGGRECFI